MLIRVEIRKLFNNVNAKLLQSYSKTRMDRWTTRKSYLSMQNGIIINQKNTFYYTGQVNTISWRLFLWRWWISLINQKSSMKSISIRKDRSSQYLENYHWWWRMKSQRGLVRVRMSTRGRSLFLGGSMRGRRTIWSCNMILLPSMWGYSSRQGRLSCWYLIWNHRCMGGLILSRGWRRREGRTLSLGRGWSSSFMIKMNFTAKINSLMTRARSRS